MQENRNGEKKPEKEPDTSTAAEDQAERKYYYDDAHGYEEYDPEADDEQT